MNTASPLVSIITPVHNGEAFLAQCLDSVLRQSYTQWECIVINNSSSDATAAIAASYCDKDKRFRLYETETLLPVIENHNFAVGKISDESVFCKILHADDFLFPDCLAEMVRIGVENPRAGVIGAFTLAGDRVRCDGLRHDQSLFPGREIGRLTLLGRIYPFWSPSSTMIRTDRVRQRQPFYAPERLHADVEAMYEILQQTDFGFVPKILTFVREHGGSETSRQVKPLNASMLSNFDLFVRYGPLFLDEDEFSWRLRQNLVSYYRFLAESAISGRDSAFWGFHSRGMKKTGYPLNPVRLAGAVAHLLMCRPRFFIKQILYRWGIRKK